MKSFRFLLLLFTIILANSSLGAESVYKWIDAKGKTQYGDKPPAKTKVEKVKMPAITIIENYANQWQPIPDVSEKTTNDEQRPKLAKPLIKYTTLNFLAPKQGQVIRANDGDVSAMLNIKPPLKPGHLVVFMLDGKEISKSKSRTANFKNLSRGSHTASFNIINQSGKVLGNSSVAFDVQRHSALFNKKVQKTN